MKIETTPREDHQMEMVVEFEAAQMEGAKRRAARKISEKAKIPGFRPGKAPYDVILRYYGEAAITEEAIEILVDENYSKAVDEAGLKPGAAGSLENVESIDPPKMKFLVPLMPTIELGDYKAVRKPYKWQAPAESEVESAIEDLRRMYGRTETVEREVQDGDFVSVDVLGTKAKAKEGDAPVFERSGYPVVAGKEKDGEWPFPGFAKKLLGAKPGEKVEFLHKFAKDDENEDVRGLTVNFEATIKVVRASIMPELSDDFAQRTGLGQTLDEFRQRMRENVNDESRSKYDDEYYEEVINLIKSNAVIKYPPQVLAHEAEHVVDDLKQRLAQQGMEFETYLKMRDTTLEKFTEEEAKPVAQKRLERGLIMDEIARIEEIKIDEETLGQEFNQAWANLSMYDEQFNKATKGGTRASKELVNAVAMDTANRLLTRRVLDRIKAIASGEAEAAATEAGEQPKAEEAAVEEKPKAKKSKKAAKTE